MEDWYWDSRTTYTTFMVGRSPASSGTTRRDKVLVAVNIPPPEEISAFLVAFLVGSARTMLKEVLDVTAFFWVSRFAVAVFDGAKALALVVRVVFGGVKLATRAPGNVPRNCCEAA
jgi:hypothetical protein